MKKILHPAASRGHNDLGWLNTWHSFSFSSFYDPKKVNFGALRVLNDDFVAPSMGFGMHAHDNMEIITIILSGLLEHQDSMGNKGIIHTGEVQVMSAGTGIRHSEYNPSDKETVNLLQIWLFPKENDIEPRYDQKSFADAMKPNELVTLISPEKNGEALWINQDAKFTMGKFDTDTTVNYQVTTEANGAYVFIIEGSAVIDGSTLNKRDALGISDTQEFSAEVKKDSQVLIIEMPMY
ncbi:pirin family protein [Mucilaginibacter sp. HMF5004]|uniref:pirin family protein n=1 Tax=Mucilaginibacter rivuli TaxID=2857527 RepID=UPI001C604769|nr:pirin family protein [Mucilaginibacter rivuli]MBW4890419.1 pirin family protein [Mucilaginibacter rivuli]